MASVTGVIFHTAQRGARSTGSREQEKPTETRGHFLLCSRRVHVLVSMHPTHTTVRAKTEWETGRDGER